MTGWMFSREQQGPPSEWKHNDSDMSVWKQTAQKTFKKVKSHISSMEDLS